MGAASSLFFSSNVEKQTLFRRVSPLDEQYDEQRERWNDLADVLRPYLREATGYTVKTWLQGSYKFGTQVRPVRTTEEFDIDLGFYFEWEGKPQDGDHSAKEIKDIIQESLEDYAKDNNEVTEVTSPKPRCARIKYKNNFHIDVPAYHLSIDDIRHLATEENDWEDSDPKAIYLWFVKSFSDVERTQVRRLIRYLKAWAALKFQDIKKRPSSILLTVLAAEASIGLGASQLGEDDDALASVVDQIVLRLEKKSVLNPINKGEDFAARLENDQWEQIKSAFNDLKDVCERACNSNSEEDAANIWQEAFDYMFPLPEEKLVKSIKEDVRNLPVPIFTPEIHVHAVSRDNSNSTREGVNQIDNVPRNCDITFNLVNAGQLPAGAEVTWTVRNEGREAELKNDLGHRNLAGFSAEEHSAYAGRHYMDCSIRHFGRVIAFRRVPVTITNMRAPRRNSPRPSWTKLR